MSETYLEGSDSPNSKKSIFIKDLRAKDVVRSTFLVRNKMLRANKNGQNCLHLQLSDRSGTIEARLWEGAESADEALNEGNLVAISGRVSEAGSGFRQVTVQHWAPIPSEEGNWEDYYPKSEQDADAEYKRLIQVFEGLENPWIRNLSLALLNDPEIAGRYPRCPAAKSIHHAFIGGLLAHTHQLVRVVQAIAPLYPELDREILLFGAAFHDFGKVYELSFDGPVGYTDEGKLVGHISIGNTLIDKEVRKIEGFPKDLELQLKHIVLSHHGRVEYGSPKPPQTLEAVMLSALDDLDSKIESITQLIKSEKSTGRWTPVHKAYQTSYYRPSTLA